MAHYVPNSSRSIRCTWHTPDLRPQLFLPRTGSVCGCLIAHQSVQSRLMQQEPHNREVQCSASRSSPQVAMLTRPNNAVCCTEPTFRVCHFSNIGHMQQHVHLYSRKPNSRGASRVVYCDNSLGSSRHQCGTNSITTASADAGGLTPGGTSSDSDSITPTPAGDSQSYASAVSSSGSGGGDNSSGRGGGSDGGSSGSSGDKPKFPVWYSVWMWCTALVYLVWRWQWRRDRRLAAEQFEREQQFEERLQQDWQTFAERYRSTSGQQPSGSST